MFQRFKDSYLETLKPGRLRQRWLISAVLALLALGVGGVMIIRMWPRPEAAADELALLASTEQRNLLAAEAVARLSLLRSLLTARRATTEITPLYDQLVTMIRQGRGLDVQQWPGIELDLDQLGLQIANGDAAAAQTIDGLIAKLGQ